MYSYEHTTELDEAIFNVFSSVLGEGKLYRVSYTYFYLILVFTEERHAKEFINKYIPKVTCDISSITSSGLMVSIDDQIKAKNIMDKLMNEYEDKKVSSSTPLS